MAENQAVSAGAAAAAGPPARRVAAGNPRTARARDRPPQAKSPGRRTAPRQPRGEAQAGWAKPGATFRRASPRRVQGKRGQHRADRDAATADGRSTRQHERRDAAFEENGEVWIWGIHAAGACSANPMRRISKAYVSAERGGSVPGWMQTRCRSLSNFWSAGHRHATAAGRGAPGDGGALPTA